MIRLNCLLYGGPSKNWRINVSLITKRICNNIDCGIAIPKGRFFIGINGALNIYTDEPGTPEARTQDNDDYCSIECLVSALKTASKELGININKPGPQEPDAKAG